MKLATPDLMVYVKVIAFLVTNGISGAACALVFKYHNLLVNSVD